MTKKANAAIPARRKAGNASAARQPKKARKDPVSGADLKPDTHGQVFTPPALVREMLALRQNKGRVLEPSCGSGAFSNILHEAGDDLVALELDPSHAPDYAKVGDFFDYPTEERFMTVLGNPAYVRHQDIPQATKAKLDMALFDGRANLYLFFIEKCIRHLADGGELIFVVPRGFPKATSARKLNRWLFEQGTITHFWETGDRRLFAGANPPCCVFRFVKGLKDRAMADGRVFAEHEGQLCFLPAGTAGVPLSSLFSVAVGGISGADELYTHEQGNLDVVCSETVRTGKTRKMLDDAQAKRMLAKRKAALLARNARRFTEDNWWEWGRGWKKSAAPRVYVNCKVRNAAPFFANAGTAYDGSVLALFPKLDGLDPAQLATILNGVDWTGLGFGADGRFEFGQRSLENALIPASVMDKLLACRSAEAKPSADRKPLQKVANTPSERYALGISKQTKESEWRWRKGARPNKSRRSSASASKSLQATDSMA